ncbi:HNH endonuclease [Candidatus Bathyarchaeota archaeon]|nr:HNH endonuclease [Candidatus Bathyarchaeota archaeon]
MASPDARTILRDVFLSDARDPDSTLTGLVTTPGVTTANFHQMIEIVLVIQGPYTIQHANETKTTLNRDSTPFLPGNYLLVTEGDVSVSDELFLTRANSNDSGARNKAFRKAVRRRDGRCVVTGLVNKYPSRGWLVWDAAHVFPVAYEGHWNARGLGRWVADGPSAGTVDSVWNGLLLSKSVHGLFDAYIFSINPDVRRPYLPMFILS